MTNFLYRFVGLLTAWLLSASVYANDIQVDGAWVRATAPERDSANVYLFITSKQAATLVGASSPAAKTIELRSMTHAGGMMKTHTIESVDLPASKRVDMSSVHGPHLALVDLKAPLKAGETVPVTLNIETVDKKSIRIEVRAEIKPLKK